MIPATIPDIYSEARKLLVDQFKNKTVIEGLIKSYADEFQEIETAVWQVVDGRLLDNAAGAQIDGIGIIVGEARQGRSDIDYKAAVRLRIRVNRSKGRTLDVIEVAKLATDTAGMRYTEVQPASFSIEAYAVAGATSVLRMLGQTRAAGTRGVMVYTTWTRAGTFIWGSSAGPVPNALCFSNSISGLSGGRLASAQDTTP